MLTKDTLEFYGVGHFCVDPTSANLART